MIHTIKRGELDALEIDHPQFAATLLLQGAQLVSFQPKTATGDLVDNWLWLSEQAEYKLGESVRGGIPICWPVFGVFDCNPDAVKRTFANDLVRMAKHGSARFENFELIDQHVSDSQVTLLLRYSEQAYGLQLDASFTLSQKTVDVSLVTTNTGNTSITFSQALHTYFPTSDITKTVVKGLDGATYTDTLQNWAEVTQAGDIHFNSEVDRIYHASPDMHIATPSQTYDITTTGSASTVVWNPWIETAKGVSQFADDAYQRMLCVEVANAHVDVVELAGGETHTLSMTLKRNAN